MENDFKKIIVKDCVACGKTRHAFFCTKKGYEIYKCTECAMLSLYPVPKSVSHIYENDYFSGGQKGFGYVNYDEDKEPMRPIFEVYLKRIEKMRGGKGLLLDVGAATGFFMGIATNLGWKTKGVDISQYAAMLAREKGLDVIQGTIVDISAKGELFDVVTMWDVVEHMSDPGSNIVKAASVLKPGGMLVLNTPDSGSFFAKMLGKNWHLIIPPEHIHYFNSKSMEKILDASGFKTVSVSRIGKKFTLEYIFLMLQKWMGFSILKRTVMFLKKHKNIGQISLPINLRDNMFVIAVKK